MAVFSSPTYYKNGIDGVSQVIGYESSSNRVVRFSFTTGDTGATGIVINVTEGTIQHQKGDATLSSIPFYITTSSTSHANANKADGYAVTGYIYGSSGKAYSGSASVVLMANTTYYVWFFPPSKTYGWYYWHNSSYYYTSYTTSGTSKFALTMSAGAGSSITVNRTSSPAGLSTGNLSNNAVIYKNDVLKITFTPGQNYSITDHKVNNSTFTSGNTHTVSGNVSVVATATPLKSIIIATDANIGSTSTITVTRYNPSYTHTITYKFGAATGTVVSKGANTSIGWTVPTSFYAQIPNSKTGECTLTIETFNGNTSLGTNTCKLTVTASSVSSSPTVAGNVVDTNVSTKALTGDESALIRYKSTAKCTLTATPKNSATISKTKIEGTSVTGPTYDGVVTATSIYANVNKSSFVFEATDSRGYSGSQTVNPTVIAYIQLTINPVLARPTPTGSEVTLSFSGNYYRGSFGAYSNTLTIRYRYKETTAAAFNSWTTVSSSNITYGSGTYRTSSAISLGNNFDYQKSYDFEIQAYDGANGVTLSTVTKRDTIKRGIPVFDWGEGDFNFHVPIKIGDTTLTEQQLQRLLALLS